MRFIRRLHNALLTITEGTHTYSSTQIDVSKEIEAAHEQYCKKKIINKNLTEKGLEHNPHITVKYGIVGDGLDNVKEIIENFPQFTITLGEISKFESDEHDVIKVEVKSSELRKLNKLITESTETVDTHPTYNPHMTIAYVKPGSCDQIIGDDYFDGMEMQVTSIQYSSTDEEITEISLLQVDD